MYTLWIGIWKLPGRLGVKNDALGLDYFIPEKDEVEKDWLPETHQKEFVAFAIGGNHENQEASAEPND